MVSVLFSLLAALSLTTKGALTTSDTPLLFRNPYCSRQWCFRTHFDPKNEGEAHGAGGLTVGMVAPLSVFQTWRYRQFLAKSGVTSLKLAMAQSAIASRAGYGRVR